MWQINVAGTARVMEAISVVNRTGGNIRQFIYPSSVAAYGPETDGPVKEDAALRAHTLPYAIHKRESDEVVRYRAESLGDCRIYILRPHIFTGATVQNYMVGALRGTPAGKSKRAARMREQGKRLPLMLPRDPQYLEKRFQFLHVDDMARLLTFLLYRPDSDPPMTIMNVAGRGDSLTIQRCAEIAQATIKRAPSKAAFHAVSAADVEVRDLLDSARRAAVSHRLLHHGHQPAATVPRSGLFAGDSVHGGGCAEGQF